MLNTPISQEILDYLNMDNSPEELATTRILETVMAHGHAASNIMSQQQELYQRINPLFAGDVDRQQSDNLRVIFLAKLSQLQILLPSLITVDSRCARSVHGQLDRFYEIEETWLIQEIQGYLGMVNYMGESDWGQRYTQRLDYIHEQRQELARVSLYSPVWKPFVNVVQNEMASVHSNPRLRKECDEAAAPPVIDLENYEEAWRPDLYIQPERLHPFDLPTFIPNGNPVARFEVYSIRFTLYQYYNKIYRYLTSALRYSNSKLLHRVLRDTRMSVLVKLRYLEAEDTAYMTDRSRMTN
ncbi:hypothetical protein BGX23_011689 [Mortierella sp. AD031]|nr:hypothetical protein BGX23_011689 [Mortierella sp. AD031]